MDWSLLELIYYHAWACFVQSYVGMSKRFWGTLLFQDAQWKHIFMAESSSKQLVAVKFCFKSSKTAAETVEMVCAA
jgi:hypothetical protein